MANIWKENRDASNHPKRNNFDLSYTNHSTFKFGYLYPVYKQMVFPGDSFRIRSAFDLKVMPLVFPLQSRLRAHMHFFYVRNKNVWPEFEDYITGVERSTPIVEPYLQVPDSDIQTGSIHDFLGVPTTVVSKTPVRSYFESLNYNKLDGSFGPLYYTMDGAKVIFTKDFSENAYSTYVFRISSPLISNVFDLPSSNDVATFVKNFVTNSNLSFFYEDDGVVYRSNSPTYSCSLSEDESKLIFSSNFISDVNTFLESYDSVIVRVGFSIVESTFPPFMPIDQHVVELSNNFVPEAGFYEYKDLNLDYYSNVSHLKAIPYRAYESIYRAYYASDIFQPLIDSNGDKQYNRFNENLSSGADETRYHLFKRNYELDFLTSALPSPQSGVAPMVGINALGQITVTDENGVTTAQAVVDEGTGRITDVAITSPLASVEHGRTVMQIAQLGMNINDFRNANALQKLLERTLRSGYRYMPFVKGHWGVAPKDQALDMPSFIGGYSRDVIINTVVSQTDNTVPEQADTMTLSKVLGGFGANGRVVDGSNHDIVHHCDDYGWIIGIMCITPTPAYSQLCDKSMLAGKNYLSYAFPEMNNTGMQPVPYTEVAPLQAYLESLEDPEKSVNDTFGYQRPNYDLVSRVDEVHGEFRSTLRQYLINRIFDGRPELGSSFLEIDPSEVNDVFVNQDPDDDVFIGQIRFQVSAKRPFPRVHIPGLF